MINTTEKEERGGLLTFRDIQFCYAEGRRGEKKNIFVRGQTIGVDQKGEIRDSKIGSEKKRQGGQELVIKPNYTDAMDTLGMGENIQGEGRERLETYFTGQASGKRRVITTRGIYLGHAEKGGRMIPRGKG